MIRVGRAHRVFTKTVIVRVAHCDVFVQPARLPREGDLVVCFGVSRELLPGVRRAWGMVKVWLLAECATWCALCVVVKCMV